MWMLGGMLRCIANVCLTPALLSCGHGRFFSKATISLHKICLKTKKLANLNNIDIAHGQKRQETPVLWLDEFGFQESWKSGNLG